MKALLFLRNWTGLRTVALAVAWLAIPAWFAKADILEMSNGDHYNGKVISMNATTVEFQSDVQGRVVLPRSKIAQITLQGAAVKASAPMAAAANKGGATNAAPVGAPLILSGTNAAAAGVPADAVVQQMRQQGVDPKVIAQVQDQILGKSSPEAAQKFNEMMGGLMTGSISVQDIRAQAQNSINQIKAAKKEMGGDSGDMLDSYLVILEKFMADTAADSTVAPTASQPATK